MFNRNNSRIRGQAEMPAAYLAFFSFWSCVMCRKKHREEETNEWSDEESDE